MNTPVHQLRTPPAWCAGAAHVDQLQALGATGVRLTDEAGTEWRATVQAFRQYGLPIDRPPAGGTARPPARAPCSAGGPVLRRAGKAGVPLARWRRTVAGPLSLSGADGAPASRGGVEVA